MPSSALNTLAPMWQGWSGQTKGKKNTQVNRCINAVVGNLGTQGGRWVQSCIRMSAAWELYSNEAHEGEER